MATVWSYQTITPSVQIICLDRQNFFATQSQMFKNTKGTFKSDHLFIPIQVNVETLPLSKEKFPTII